MLDVTRTWIHVRWLIPRDVPEVMEIDRRAFPARHRWTEPELLMALRQRNCIGMVAEHGDMVVGFMVYELQKQRIDLLKLAVHPEFQRQHVGRQLMRKLQGKLSAGRRQAIEVRVPDGNLDGHLWLRAMGFRAVEVERRGFGREDAYVFRFDCVEADRAWAPRVVAE